MSPKPAAVPRVPGRRRPVNEAAIRALESKYDDSEAPSPKEQARAVSRDPEPADLQAPEPASLQTPEPAVSQVQKPAAPPTQSRATKSDGRSGTITAPYVRATDGRATRSTTVHFPIDTHQRLRLSAASNGKKISAIVNEAVLEYFAAGRG